MPTQDKSLFPRSPSGDKILFETVLVHGSDEALLGTRTMVLENAGFRVLSSLDQAEAEAVIDRGDIALVVLCRSLSSQDCEAVVKVANERNPPVKTLVLTAGESKCAEHLAAASVSAFDGPRKLVETVRLLLC
jgi:DNA-binding response OmpR family regulator